jgi:hypothetical protein
LASRTEPREVIAAQRRFGVLRATKLAESIASQNRLLNVPRAIPTTPGYRAEIGTVPARGPDNFASNKCLKHRLKTPKHTYSRTLNSS